jgi:MFS family permease
MINRGRGDIRRLAAASAISGTGDWAASTALALAVYAKTGSAVWLSVSFLLTRIASALVAPLSGIIADRLDRRRVMIGCDLLGAVTYAGMAVTGAPLPLITLGSLAALLHSPFGAADLSWANGTLSAANNVGQLAGPALGGVLYATVGAGPAFWANAASFVVSAGCIAAIRGRFRSETPRSSAGGESGVWAGVLGCLVFGVFVAAVGVSPWFALIPLFSLLFAFSDSFAFVGFNGIYQRRTPDEIRGRVFAAIGAVMTIATAVSFGFAGFLVEAVGWRPVYLVGGLVDIACAVVFALSLRWTPWRRAEAGPVPHTTGS